MRQGKTLAEQLGVTPSALSKASSKGHYCGGHPVFKWVVLSPSGRILGYIVPEDVCLSAIGETQECGEAFSAAPVAENRSPLPEKRQHVGPSELLELHKKNQLEPPIAKIAQVPPVLEHKPLAPADDEAASEPRTTEEPEDLNAEFGRRLKEMYAKSDIDLERRWNEQLKRRQEKRPMGFLEGLAQLGITVAELYLQHDTNKAKQLEQHDGRTTHIRGSARRH